MESLQEKALVRAMLYPRSDEFIVTHLLLRTINFNKLSESTLSLIWFRYSDNSQIIEKIPSQFIKNGFWYTECKTCCLKGCKACETEDCKCEDCDRCEDCELKNCICLYSSESDWDVEI